MTTFSEVPLDANDIVTGDVVADVRKRPGSILSPARKVVVFLASGASITIDGSFPARAEVISGDEVLDLMRGHAIRAVRHLREDKARPLKTEGLHERRHVFRFELENSSVDLEWASVGDDQFDVDPAPRLDVRPSYRISPAT